jgi:hypothetical protein
LRFLDAGNLNVGPLSQAQRFAVSAAQLGVAAIYPFRQFTVAPHSQG